MKLHQTKCPNCASTEFTGNRCEYCGSRFNENVNPVQRQSEKLLCYQTGIAMHQLQRGWIYSNDLEAQKIISQDIGRLCRIEKEQGFVSNFIGSIAGVLGL